MRVIQTVSQNHLGFDQIQTSCYLDKTLLTIDKIRGIFDYSAACKDVVDMQRNPRVLLHSEVREYALSLLHNHVSLTQLQQQCRVFAQERWDSAVGDNKCWYLLSDGESTSLYRTLARQSGIPQRSAAETNLDNWFRSVRAIPPDPLLPALCLFYQPCEEGKEDCFCLILSTPQQRDIAWKYGHKHQMLNTAANLHR